MPRQTPQLLPDEEADARLRAGPLSEVRPRSDGSGASSPSLASAAHLDAAEPSQLLASRMLSHVGTACGDDDVASSAKRAGWWGSFYEEVLGRKVVEWRAVEVELYGISVALVDATPRELMQLNLRHLSLALCSSSTAATSSVFRIGSLSADNLLPDSFNPVVIASQPKPSSSAHFSAATASERPASFDAHSSAAAPPTDAIELIIDRRSHERYRLVSITFAPLRVVLDLALLNALSHMPSSDGRVLDARPYAIGSSQRLRDTFVSLRTQGIRLPDELLSDFGPSGAGAQYLQRVVINKMHLQVTVAMASTYVRDPSSEILEVIERLLPEVPKRLEWLMPVLSNLASITEANFDLKAFERSNTFATPSSVARDAGKQWAWQLGWMLMRAMGSSDMLGNPLGLLHRWAETGQHAQRHFLDAVQTGSRDESMRALSELAHGFLGGSADSLSRVLRALFG